MGKDGERTDDDRVEDAESEMIGDLLDEVSTVVIGDREFDLGVPSTRSIIWFVNALCALGRRSQRHVTSLLDSPSPLDVVWAIGEVMQEDDVINFGIAALQFDSKKEGRKFLQDNGVPLPQVLQAMAISIRKSGPLMEQLKNVLEGLVGRGTMEALIQTAVQDSL